MDCYVVVLFIILWHSLSVGVCTRYRTRPPRVSFTVALGARKSGYWKHRNSHGSGSGFVPGMAVAPCWVLLIMGIGRRLESFAALCGKLSGVGVWWWLCE